MVTVSACKGSRRFVEIFEEGLRPRTCCMIVALGVLALCFAFPAPAGATCNPVGHSHAVKQIRVAQPFLAFGRARPTVVASSTGMADDEASIVGFWHILFFNSDGSTFDEGYDVWHRDGTEILNDNAPPQPANGAGTVCLGVYEKTGPRTYKLKHPFWSFDATATLTGTGVFLEEVTLDENGNAFSGTYTFRTYDLNGNLTYEQKGNLKAQRITPD